MIKTLLPAIVLALAALMPAAAVLTPAAAQAAPIRIVALGDSLTAGYGLGPEDGFTVQLEKALKAKGYDVTVINAGVSGDTAEGGLARLDWALGDGADAAIVELGANDMLRGYDPAITGAALDKIMAKLSQRGIPTLIAGMLASPNLGPAYKARFDPLYPDLAAKWNAMLYPFFLDGVAADSGLLQSDMLHPNAKGVAQIVDRILPSVERLIAEAQKP